MARIRKRLNTKRRRVGFVPSKPWTPKPTFDELMQRMRENMHRDIKTVLPVHDAFSRMRAGFEDMRLGTVFPPRMTSWTKELRKLMTQSVTQPRTIAISTPSAKSDAFDQMFVGSNPSSWKTVEQTDPFMEQLADVLRAYKAQPTDKLILPPVMYDALGESTSQPMMTFKDGQAITLSVDVGRGYDETAGMLVRRHPNGDIEILHRFKIVRQETQQ